ncbi:ABC transporter permease [Indiicoccus explosivorum]|uniref:ABC transporter permease n=1 Tax=Indiicoccus explosivorum TaxID=1917864 RepID=UPI000B43928F|nr:ABC transporter permease [Indiicoccus explosivorum]
MRSFWTIFSQAFWTKAKSKSFIITTLIAVAGFFLMANLPSIISSVQESGVFGGDGEQTLYISDGGSELAVQLQRQLSAAEADFTAEETGQPAAELDALLEQGEIDAYIELTPGSPLTARYVSETAGISGMASAVESAVQTLQTARAAESLGLTQSEAAALFMPAQFEREAISDSSRSEEELSEARGLVYILIFLLYFAIIYYSNMIAMEVATEKSSRVMEILISSVSPVKHMFAKIAGIGTLGIIQMLIFGAAAYVALESSSSDLSGGFFSVFGFSSVRISTILFAVLFFLLGYFLYAMLAALLGSIVSRIEDVQQLMLPMMLLIILSSFIAFSGLTVPEAGFVTVTSYIPFFTPLVMFLRVGMLDIPVWEPLLSIAVMLLTIALLGWFGARVYRGGVLMYGSSQSLKDIRKAIQLGNKN